MNQEDAVCPNCCGKVPIGKLAAEESFVPVSDAAVVFVGRWFETECANCGPTMHFSAGHHGTLTVKKMRNLFPKREWKRMRRAMSQKEAKIFRECLDGRRMPTDEQRAQWVKILEQVRVNYNSTRIIVTKSKGVT